METRVYQSGERTGYLPANDSVLKEEVESIL